VGYAFSSLDELGDDTVRKIRPALGIAAFGANAWVLAPGVESRPHFHEQQDELYFVHEGRAGFEIEGETFEVGRGGLVHVESTTPRRFWNAGDGDLVLLVVGGKGGYVERDGQMVDPADVERRKAVAEGDLSVIRRRAAHRSV